MRKLFLFIFLTAISTKSFCWGFYAHKTINHYAVFLLPPQMVKFYKPNIDFITEHAVDPDKRRYAIAAEGSRHYIDLDHYGDYPYNAMPHRWNDAVENMEGTLWKNME